MPARKKSTEWLVGLFIFIGLTMLGGLILQFGKFRDRIRGTYELTVVFDDASGVIKGSEIRMGGAKIGEVTSLPELNDDLKVEVELTIRESIHIPKGSSFQINSATLLGDKLIVVIPSTDQDRGSIPPNSRLSGAGPTGLDALQNNAEIVSKDVRRILEKAELTLAKVDEAVGDIRGASNQLEQSLAKVNSSLLADKNLANFDTTLKNLTASSAQWRETSAKLGPVVKEAQDAIDAIRSAAATAETTLKSADSTIAEARPALKKLPGAVDEFSATTRKAGAALDRMAAGEGVLGALSSDNDVAFDFKAFMKNLRDHGILRYRDTAESDSGGKNGSSQKSKSTLRKSLPGRPGF